MMRVVAHALYEGIPSLGLNFKTRQMFETNEMEVLRKYEYMAKQE